jgi:hypothetical protein
MLDGGVLGVGLLAPGFLAGSNVTKCAADFSDYFWPPVNLLMSTELR